MAGRESRDSQGPAVPRLSESKSWIVHYATVSYRIAVCCWQGRELRAGSQAGHVPP